MGELILGANTPRQSKGIELRELSLSEIDDVSGAHDCGVAATIQAAAAGALVSLITSGQPLAGAIGATVIWRLGCAAGH